MNYYNYNYNIYNIFIYNLYIYIKIHIFLDFLSSICTK